MSLSNRNSCLLMGAAEVGSSKPTAAAQAGGDGMCFNSVLDWLWEKILDTSMASRVSK